MRGIEILRKQGLSAEDIRAIRDRGKSPAEVAGEIRALAEGTRYVRLARPCRPGDGIRRLSRAEQARLIRLYEDRAPGIRISKFVAASGAATRMFLVPSACLNRGLVTRESIAAAARQGDEEAREMRRFVRNLKRFAFAEELESRLRARGLVLDDLMARGDYLEICQELLEPRGLNYARLPKALIPFHLYPSGARTPLEEHLLEGTEYLRDRRGVVRVHFTVPPDSLSLVRRHIAAARKRFQDPGTRLLVTLSAQGKSTDTIAVDDAGRPARDAEGGLVFVPGGHGALLGNLQQVRGDLVFVRTIDNVLPERLARTALECRRMLGGCFLELQERMHGFAEALSSGAVTGSLLRAAEEFIRSEFSFSFPRAYHSLSARRKAAFLRERLDRPLRVCGMVRLRGKRGGRAFWVRQRDGTESLQIVEGAQVDMRSPGQRRIWESADYFNPADMACGMRDHRGDPYDLRRYSDREAGFVSLKTVAGREVRVLERPGLWNGGMSQWNTVFVEIPAATVHPVKSVLDLLDRRHRPC